MDNVFHTQLDLEVLADAIAPLIADRLGLDYGGKPPARGRKPAANEPDNWPQDEQGPDDSDPWAEDPPERSARSAGRTASREGSSGGSADSRRSGSRQSSSRGGSSGRSNSSRGARTGGTSRSGGGRQAPCVNASDYPDSGMHYDRFEREWNFGEDAAPECHGGHPAARLIGESQSGNEYEVWACPVGFGKDYKKKCDLWDYVG